MNRILQPIYEAIIGYRLPPDANCSDLYFDSVYNSTDYTLLFLIMILVPLLFMLAYYKAWDPSLPNTLNWLIVVVIVIIGVGLVSAYGLLPSSSMEIHTLNGRPSDDYMSPVQFNFQMGLVSSALSVLPIMVFTYIFRFISKNNKKNPF